MIVIRFINNVYISEHLLSDAREFNFLITNYFNKKLIYKTYAIFMLEREVNLMKNF